MTRDIPTVTEDLISKYGYTDDVDVFEICRREDIALLPFSDKRTKELAVILGMRLNMDASDGFALQVRDKRCIFYDDRRSTERQRSTVAHELGHIVLGHTSGFKSGVDCSRCEEMQADSFAFRLLYPERMS